MKDDFFEYEGEKYPCRWIYFPKLDGTFCVSVASLEKKLIDDESGNCVSDKAESIDEQIFFYVDDCLIDENENCLANHIEKEFA